MEPISAGSEGPKRPVSAESGKRKAPSPIQPEIEKKPKVTIPSKTDKIRRMARKGFEETICAIFTELVENKDLLGTPLNQEIDFEDPTLFAEELEEELFKAYNNDGIPNDTVILVDLVQEQIQIDTVQLEGSFKSSTTKKNVLLSG